MSCDPDPALLADIDADLAQHAKTLATEHVKRELLHIAQKTRDEVRSRIERLVYRNDILNATLRTYLTQDDADKAMDEMRSEALNIVWEAVDGTFLATALRGGRQGRGLAGSSLPTPPTEAASNSAESSVQGLVQEVASTSHAPSTFSESPDQMLIGEVELEEVAAPIVDNLQPLPLEPSSQIQFQRSPSKRSRTYSDINRLQTTKKPRNKSSTQQEDMETPPRSSASTRRSARASLGQAGTELSRRKTIPAWEAEGEYFVFFHDFPEPGWYVVSCDLGQERNPIKCNVHPLKPATNPPPRGREISAISHFNDSVGCRGHDCSRKYTAEEIMAEFALRVVSGDGEPVDERWAAASNYRLEQDLYRYKIKQEQIEESRSISDTKAK